MKIAARFDSTSTRRIGTTAAACVLCAALLGSVGSAQRQPAPSTFAPVLQIEPPAQALPSEVDSAAITRFSFIAYGDTRSQVDGRVLQPDHAVVIDRMLSKIQELASTPFPVRFVLHSGDAVTRGTDASQWNVSFAPLVEKLTRGAGVSYFYSVGNHDEPGGDSGRVGLHNALGAVSRLIAPEGSPRRLNGFLTYAFGYANLFVIVIDSNIASDEVQLAWVTDQLEHLDRGRYRHVVALFHHPMLSSGPHGGSSPDPAVQNNRDDDVEPATGAMRTLYGPLFRRHHVPVTITGHDHLYEHWVERYRDTAGRYRIDHLVTGGGGAPIYTYRGEPDVQAYLAAGAAQNVRLDHLLRPGVTSAQNPHHFVVVRVDGDRLSLEVVGTGPTEFKPYSGRSGVALGN